MPQPLPMDGVKVLDLTQIYNGPYATFLLAMAGADVVKVEPPGGEHLRKRQGASGAAFPFAMLNANKKAMTLNLKTDEGRAILLALARDSDVIAENFAPGVMDRLGIGAAVLQQENPRLIYASGSGYGLSGPYRDYPAMDLTVQAISGVMGTTGFETGPPLKTGPAMCDFFGGVHLFGAIAAALYERERTGIGRLVEVAMMDTVYASLASNLGMYFGSGTDAGAPRPERTGNRHGGLSLSPYNVYEARDGHVAIIANNETHWRAIIDALGLDALGADPRFQTMQDRCANMDALDAAITAVTRLSDKEDLFARLLERRVPCAPVRRLCEVVNDPHLLARGMLRRIDHPEYGELVVPASPLRFSAEPQADYRPSQALGCDSRAVLAARLGFTEQQLDRLERDEVI